MIKTYGSMIDLELDSAVAEAIGGFLIDEDGYKRLLCATDNGARVSHKGDAWSMWRPSKSHVHFNDVRREIIRRGWSWWCSYNADAKRYYFGIGDIDDFMLGLVGAMADSLERAGCIAFLQALEESNGED